MPLEAFATTARISPGWRGLSPPWRTAILRLVGAAFVLFALFARDWADMASHWWNISTYNHILLVPLILTWLVWQRGAELAKLQPSVWWPGLIPVTLAAFIWVLGAFSGLNLARQAGVVGMLAASVPLLAGPHVTKGLLFPLFYMVFLVPCGEELVTILQTVTAKITITLVHASGIPAAVDGVFIDTPAGLFEVAEACSGVKFLIAMVAFGTLMAHVCFVSWKRRAALLAACVAVPILANGVRAWGTIYAAQFVGVERAAGIDHIIYGWVFFGVVLGLIIALSWRFFDRPADDAFIDASRIAADPLLCRLRRYRMRAVPACAAFLAIVFGVQGWALAANRLSAPVPEELSLPAVPGWTRVDYRPKIWWEPRAEGAAHRLLGSYADEKGRRVEVFFAMYAAQTEGQEAGGFGQGALTPGTAWAWQSPGASVQAGHGEHLLAEGRVGRAALTWYRSGDLLTGSNTRLKLAAMADRLTLRERPTMLLIISAEDLGAHAGESITRAFVDAVGPVDAWMDRLGGLD
ncbi:exosortase A [Novosphingobium sp. M1R2S20]|uniref:Exosortase A n=1 Tax=Novosphingobium rhizovicinum TaxID=3228928 RepID=A0ABV3RFT3_9SPHN